MTISKSKEELLSIAKVVKSRTDFAKALGINYYNGTTRKLLNGLIDDYKIDISHFDINGSWKKIKYVIEKRICPVCNSEFDARIYPSGKDTKKTGKITCSKSCSNTYFRTFSNDAFLEKHGGLKRCYRSFCFQYWKKQCALCGWLYMLEVHHIDGNREHNSKENLIPLCLNHHKITLLPKKSPIRELVEKEISAAMAKKEWVRIFDKMR